MILKATTIVLLTGFLTACSSSQTKPDFEEYLATNIRSDGSKEFFYTVTLSNDGGSKRGTGKGKHASGGMRVNGGSNGSASASGGITVSNAGGGHRGSRGGHPGSRPDEKMSEQLEKKLLATGFCRDGWMERERHIQPPNASIRGECNETATDRDRENFPNTEDISS